MPLCVTQSWKEATQRLISRRYRWQTTPPSTLSRDPCQLTFCKRTRLLVAQFLRITKRVTSENRVDLALFDDDAIKGVRAKREAAVVASP